MVPTGACCTPAQTHLEPRLLEKGHCKRGSTHWSPGDCWAPPVKPYLSTCFSPGTALPLLPGSDPNQLPPPWSASLSAAPGAFAPWPCLLLAIDSTFSRTRAGTLPVFTPLNVATGYGGEEEPRCLAGGSKQCHKSCYLRSR